MAPFKASEAVSKLEWSFKPYVDAEGVSPEPSSTALFAFQQNWTNTVNGFRRRAEARAKKLADEIGGKSTEELQAEIIRWAEYDWDEAIRATDEMMSGTLGRETSEELHVRLAALVDEVTGGCPSKALIMELPGRVRATFLGWFYGELIDPESGAAVTMS